MNVMVDGRFVRKWMVILLSLGGVASLGVSQANAAQILYVVSSITVDGTAGNGNDREVADHLVSSGHTVTLADDDLVSAGDLTGKDLVLISSSVGSGAPGINPLVRNTLKTSALPAINYEPGLFDEFGWQTATVFNNPGGQTDLGITSVGASHPLGAGKPAGPLSIIEPGLVATFSLPVPPIPDSAIIIATNANPGCTSGGGDCTGVPAIFAFEQGSALIDASVTEGRKVAWFFNASTGVPMFWNADAYALFDAAVAWALSVPTTAPVTVKSRSPGAGQVGVFPDASLRVELKDGGSTQVDTNTVSLKLDANPATPLNTSKSGTITTLTFTPPALFLPGSAHAVTLVFSDTAAPPKSFTNTWSFTVENYATLPGSSARPAGTVDINSPGFNVFVHQARADAGLPNNTLRGEGQLRSFLIDWMTGAPYVNHVVGGTPLGSFVDADVINWNQEVGIGGIAEFGNFRSTSTPPFPDEAIPGIPGDEGSTDNIAAELVTYLDLPAGLIRLGVNSDEGFRVTSEVNLRDVARELPLGVFSGSRGAGDTLFSVFVESAGLYPIRLIWYEGVGAANLEFFSVDITSGQKILINDRSNAKALKAYRASTFALAPIVQRLGPAPDTANVNGSAEILAELRDQDRAIDTNSVSLFFNGTLLLPTLVNVSKSGAVTRITYDPPGLLPANSTNQVTLAFRDNAVPPNSFTNAWKFVVQDYTGFPVIPPSYKMPAGSVNLTQVGFSNRMHQLDFARPGGNNLPAPELQLDPGFPDPSNPGQPAPNVIDTSDTSSGTWSGDIFVETGVINYNNGTDPSLPAVGMAGNFRPDGKVPGVPGSTLSTNNFVMAASTLLDLKAGIYQFGVNSDDGFLVTTGPNPRDAFGLRLGFFDGTRGAGDTLFSFIVQEDGIYPFRLLWWQGDGAASVEWFLVDATTGQRVLINSPDSRAVKAYRASTITRPYLRSVSPAPSAFGVPVTTNIEIRFVDGTVLVDTNSIQLSLNGQAASPLTKTRAAGEVTITYDPPQNLAGATLYTNLLTFSDTGSPVITRTVQTTFLTDKLATTLPPYAQDSSGLVVFEAENFDTNAPGLAHTWQFAKTPSGYSGDGTMYSLPDSGASIGLPAALTDSPRLSYKVSFVKTGTHYFWFRGSDGGGNSMHAGIDEVDPTGTTLENMDDFAACCGTRAPGGTSWVWVGGIDATAAGRATLEVASVGVHTIHIWMREDGQIVDKLLITTNPSFIPTGLGPPESERVGQVTPPRFSPPIISGNQVTITWTGAGTLQVATNLTGKVTDWSNVDPQPTTNTFNLQVGSTQRSFYRISQ